MRLILALMFSLPAYAINDKYVTSETYPNKELTSGEVFQDATTEKVCVKGYAQSIRNVSKGTKRQVKQQYNIEPRHFELYSIDHFIPLCLGGTNNPANLWPQRIQGIVYGAEQKTLADNYLFKEVCEGRMRLAKAQTLIQRDWVKVYLDCCSDYNSGHVKHKRVRGKKGHFSNRSDDLLDEMLDIKTDLLRDLINMEFDLLEDLLEAEYNLLNYYLS